MTSRKDELESLIQAYADASEDSTLQVALGTPGGKVMDQDESTDTGQQWISPGFVEALTTGIGQVAGNWERDEFEIGLLATSVELSYTPVSIGSLFVFRDGLALTTNEFSWTAGTKIIEFSAGTAGTLIAQYQRKF